VTPVHVVAAAFRGKLVYFQVIAPWNRPWRERWQNSPHPMSRSASQVAANFYVAWLLACVAFGIFLAWRNIRQGRSDSRGAVRIAGYLFGAMLFGYLAAANHVPSAAAEWQVFTKAAGAALYQAGFAWLLYMATEPFIRRRWPELLIGWSRLLEGRFHDPMIGREILLGCLSGTAVSLVWYGTRALPAWFDIRGWNAVPASPSHTGSLALFLGSLISRQDVGILSALQATLVLCLALIVGRNKALALGITVIVITAGLLTGEKNWVMDVTNEVICVALVVGTLRYGVLAGATAAYVEVILNNGPLTASLSRWYFGRSCFLLAWVLAIALYGFRTSLGNQAAFGDGLLEATASPGDSR
jgi:hypothetical protein